MTCKGCELIKECRETGAELQTCKRYKPKTNFDRITDSPKALAEWLNEHSDYCREIQNWQCDKCPYGDKDCPIENTWLDWLNEENKE